MLNKWNEMKKLKTASVKEIISRKLQNNSKLLQTDPLSYSTMQKNIHLKAIQRGLFPCICLDTTLPRVTCWLLFSFTLVIKLTITAWTNLRFQPLSTRVISKIISLIPYYMSHWMWCPSPWMHISHQVTISVAHTLPSVFSRKTSWFHSTKPSKCCSFSVNFLNLQTFKARDIHSHQQPPIID